MYKTVIIGAEARSLINFRGDLIQTLVHAGHEVIAMAADTDHETKMRIEKFGASFRSYPVQRNGMNPIQDLKTFISLSKVFMEIKPDIILAYTIKPVIWAAFAIRTLNYNINYYALITGLGYAFHNRSGKQNLLNQLVIWLYKLSLAKAKAVIFQNKDNKQSFIDMQIIDKNKGVIVNGSGINTSYYVCSDLPKGRFVFLLIARLLGDKGLREYAEAARMVKLRYPDVVFNLLGPEDPSPDRIPISEVNQWHESGSVCYCGASQDVRPFIRDCHVYVLPSYHEGIPRTVLEAMSMGRPILTTDVPGCRETVVHGENGLLVPHRNAEELAEAMIWFIEHRDELEQMAQKSRQFAEERFDVRKVNDEMMRIMELQNK